MVNFALLAASIVKTLFNSLSLYEANKSLPSEPKYQNGHPRKFPIDLVKVPLNVLESF